MRLANCRVYKGRLQNEWVIKPFQKHPKSSKFIVINSSLQFMHNLYPFLEIRRYLEEIDFHIDFCETSHNGKKIQKFFFKDILSLTIEYRMYLKFLQKPRWIGWLNKVKFLKRQFHSEKLSLVHKKETEHSFELSFSICVFYWRIFTLEIQNFSLENHHMMNVRQPFCWWMTFTKVSNPFFPPPSKWLTIWLFWGGWGGMGYLVWVSIFFPNLWS